MRTPLLLLVSSLVALAGCKPAGTGLSADSPTATPEPAALELVFTYGSEKQDWVTAVTDEFNRRREKTASGQVIRVKPLPMGSGECIDTLLSGEIKAHITSPASGAFIKLGNAQSRVKTGKDLVGDTENLVLSPVVIAMWKPMAEALGWGQRPIGWAEILKIAQDPQGWASFGHSEWGRFRFGHTSPAHSNSGLISLFAEVYAATGKTGNLTLNDVYAPATAHYLAEIENSVVHYGSSTGFFGKKMFTGGPQYLSAAVLYENMVIESAGPGYQLPFPIVAVYPKEGTFWSDHPIGVVNREWVTSEHTEAAKRYIAFLLEPAQQKRALEFGFRPALPDIALTDPIDIAHGVNPKEPQTTLEVPPVDVMNAILQLWQQNKKRSSVELVFDISGSMQEDNKIAFARDGAVTLLDAMHDQDDFALLPFNQTVASADRPSLLGPQRARKRQQIAGLFANGGTALYDAILAAHRTQSTADPTRRITAIVVLTDGQDTNSATSLPKLIEQIKATPEHETVRIFTIGYGKDADAKILKQISDATQGKSYEGKPENIREVFRDISTFF